MGWLSGWSYAKEISLTGQAGAGTLYQVELDIGDSAGGDFHLEGHCTNFPQDIEVTDNDGTTLLDFWIEDITADPLKMRVEVADDLGSNRTIWVYYGKSGATTNSNGANTFLQYHGVAAADFMDAAAVSPSGIAYEGKIRRIGTSNVVWGLSDHATLGGDALYVQSYSISRYAYAMNDGTNTQRMESPNLTSGTWYRAKITNDGTTVYGYIDDNQIGASGITTNLPNENLGLYMHEFSGQAEQSWSFARKYNSPEPAFSSAGSEQSAPTAGNPYWYYNMLKRRN